MPNPTLVGLARILAAVEGKFSKGIEDRGAIGPWEQCQLYVHPGDPPDAGTFAVKSPDGTEWLSWDRDAAGNLYLSWRKDEPGQPASYERWRRDPNIPERLVSVEFPEKDFYVVGGWPTTAPTQPDRPPTPDIGISGKHWTSYDAFWSPCCVSMLSPFADICTEDDWRAFFEVHAAAGFTAVRSFCGALVWSDRPQSAVTARERMPRFFDVAEEYGMAVWAVLVTDSKDGNYDVEEHLRLCAPLTNRPHVVPTLCNELGHSTQNDDVTFENMRAWGAKYFGGQPWSVGAPVDGVTAPPDAKPRPGQHFDRDEPSPVDWQDMDGDQEFRGHGGPSMDAHLDRGRDFWDQARRVREIYACSEVEEVPCFNAEPGRDFTDPAWYAVLGALDRGFSAGGGCHHCEHGLSVSLPDPGATDRMRAYVLAHQLSDQALGGQRGWYANSGHAGSPVGTYPQEVFDTQLCRHYAFTNGNIGVSPVIGVDPNLVLNWSNGWQPIELLKSWTAQHDGKQLQLWRIAYVSRGRTRAAD
jgi:hypothetical protein